MAAVLGLSIAAGLLVVATARFDYVRLGHFPDTADSILFPCCQALGPQAGAALVQAPLAAYPFWDASQRARGGGDTARARRLAEEAVRRDPRLVAARLWLAQDAISLGRFDSALGHLDWLYANAPAARPMIGTAIAQLAMLPAARPTVERHAALSPDWLQSVVDTLIRLKADPGTIFRISGGGAMRSGLLRDDKVAFIRDLIARKDYDQAYLAWVSNLPPNAVGAVGYVYDQTFRNLPGLPPFSWNLADSDAASVDYASGGGLSISYFGNTPAHFLDQTLMLPPGTFRLRIVSSVQSEGEPNKATLSLTCAAESNAVLATVPISSKGSPAAVAAIVHVMPNCPIQTLSLDGAPSEYPVTTQIDVKSVAIDKYRADA